MIAARFCGRSSGCAIIFGATPIATGNGGRRCARLGGGSLLRHSRILASTIRPSARVIGDRHFELRDAAIAPLPGAVEALHQLRSLGVTLGLLTNGGSEGQRAKIERFALATHFDYIGIEGEVGHGKPHRASYESALRNLGATPNDTWMVGDNLEWDVSGAQAVGIYGIWLDKYGHGLPSDTTAQPDRIIRALAELVPINTVELDQQPPN